MTAPGSTRPIAPPDGARPENPPPTARTALGWLVSIVGFPVGGLVAIAVGPVDDPVAAALGGLGAGLVIGTVQWLTLRGPLRLPAAWIPATGLGLAVGLTIGSALVGYGTSMSDLLVQGTGSGICVGIAQGLVLSRRLSRRLGFVWAAAASLTWPLGWTVTAAAGIDVDRQFAVFGLSGALAYSILSAAVALLLHRAHVSARGAR